MLKQKAANAASSSTAATATAGLTAAPTTASAAMATQQMSTAQMASTNRINSGNAGVTPGKKGVKADDDNDHNKHTRLS